MGEAGEPTRVLLVDDDPRYAALVAERLAERGLATVTGVDPAEAAERLNAEPFSCLVVDLRLNDVDGASFVERVHERQPDLPIVVLTGEEAPTAAVEAGATDYHRRDPAGADVDLLANRVETVVEKYRAERALREQRHRNDQFVRMVAHDLRNPMTVAQGWLDLLGEDDVGVESAREKTLDAFDRMTAIVENLETLARDGEAADEVVELSSVATSAWEVVDAEEGADLHVEYGPRLRADASMLQQALENLFENAVEHGQPHPDVAITVRVGVSTSLDGFYVEDDGTGVPEAVRETVFQSGVTGSDGTGLGLAIVERIADAHGWDVTVGENDFGGARFEFTGVELADVEPPVPQDEGASLDRESSGGRRATDLSGDDGTGERPQADDRVTDGDREDDGEQEFQWVGGTECR